MSVAARKKKKTRWQVLYERRCRESRDKFSDYLYGCSERIPMLKPEIVSLWFLEMPTVVSAEFVCGRTDILTIKTTDGVEHKFENAVRPQMLVDAMSFLLTLMNEQLKKVSWYKKDNAVLFSVKKRRRPKKRKKTPEPVEQVLS